MADTPQPMAGETEVTRAEALDQAADAFKAFTTETPVRPRGPDGKFVSAEAEEIEAPEEAPEAEAGAESQEEGDTGEAAEEAQPLPVILPTSWPVEHTETWENLPPEAQAVIAEREGQRDTAVNAKFQEAANVRREAESRLTEAQTSRQDYIAGLDQVMSLIQPQWPSASMLDYNSSDYNPDQYHLLRAQAEQSQHLISQLGEQRQTLAAQQETERTRGDVERFNQINGATRDAFMKAVPDVADQAKAPAIFQGLMDYAVSQGAPADLFQSPTTALEWHTLWKAKEYDRLQSAKAQVGKTAVPEQKKAQPAVKPGVATQRSAIDAARRGKDFNRLASEGSIAAGAAMWKHMIKE